MGTVVPKSDLPVFYVGIVTVSNSGRCFEWLNSLDWATIAGSLGSGRVSIHPCRVYRKHSSPEIQVFFETDPNRNRFNLQPASAGALVELQYVEPQWHYPLREDCWRGQGTSYWSNMRLIY